MLRKLVTGLAVAGLAAGLVVGAVAPASAADPEGVPIAALPGCAPTAPDRGGWALRDFYATGTDETSDDDPVRPRHLRLGELCNEDGQLGIPGRIAEVPITDWDGYGYEPSCATESAPICSGGGGGGGGGGGVGDPMADTYGDFEMRPGFGWCNYRPMIPSGVRAMTDTEPGVGCSTTTPEAGGYSYALLAPPDAQVHPDAWAVARARVDSIVGDTLTVTFGIGAVSQGAPGGNRVFQLGLRLDCINASGTQVSQGSTYTGNHSSTVNLVEWERSCSPGWTPYMLWLFDGFRQQGPHASGVLWSVSGQQEQYIGSVGGYQSSVMTVGDNAAFMPDGASQLVCVTGGATVILPVDRRYRFADPLDGAPLTFGVPELVGEDYIWAKSVWMPLGGGSWSPVACERVVSLSLVVCVWVGFGPTAFACTETIWDAQLFVSHHRYGDEGPSETMCGIPGFWSPECIDILYPPYIDPLDFGSVCGSPPEAAWLDFSWLPAVIGYYADCLFVPRGGWDHSGELAAALEQSPVGAVEPMLSELVTAFTFSETCGVLISADIVGSPLVIDTCAWTWAAPIKSVLTLAMWIAFLIWALQFVAATIVGLVNRKSPNPLGDGEEG